MWPNPEPHKSVGLSLCLSWIWTSLQSLSFSPSVISSKMNSLSKLDQLWLSHCWNILPVIKSDRLSGVVNSTIVSGENRTVISALCGRKESAVHRAPTKYWNMVKYTSAVSLWTGKPRKKCWVEGVRVCGCLANYVLKLWCNQRETEILCSGIVCSVYSASFWLSQSCHIKLIFGVHKLQNAFFDTPSGANAMQQLNSLFILCLCWKGFVGISPIFIFHIFFWGKIRGKFQWWLQFILRQISDTKFSSQRLDTISALKKSYKDGQMPS